MTNAIAFMPIFAAKKSRRRKIAEAMLPTMLPFSDPTHQLLSSALMADNAVKSEERAEERITAEVVNAMEATAKNGSLTPEILTVHPKLHAVIKRRPELQQTIENGAKRLFPVSDLRNLQTDVLQEFIKDTDKDKLKKKLEEFSPRLNDLLEQ
ncbi:MAG: hypothetical protein AB2604_01545 [Candidatus Thiodiazotropha taylori]